MAKENAALIHSTRPTPYLLRGVAIIRPNQVWSTDITYIRLPRGIVYQVAIIDWYSRKVLHAEAGLDQYQCAILSWTGFFEVPLVLLELGVARSRFRI